MRRCASAPASARAAPRRPAPASWTANRSRPRKGGPPHSAGYDGGKQVKGRKRHLLVAPLGLVVTALVHPADVPDGVGGQRLLAAIPHLTSVLPRLRHRWVDAAYQGSFKDWVEETLRWTVAVVKRPARWVWGGPGQEPPEVPRGFVVLPRRWIVERALGWIGRWRRTSKDDEYLPETSECVIYLTMIRAMLRRLAET